MASIEVAAAAERRDEPAAGLTPRRRRSRGRGQSLVEFGLALPVLLLIMLGTLDLGRAFFDYIQMRNAAYEGARYGARFPTDTSGIQSRVTAHGIPSGTSITVSLSPSDCCTVDETGTVTVRLSHTFTPITVSFLQSFFSIGPWTIQTTGAARVIT